MDNHRQDFLDKTELIASIIHGLSLNEAQKTAITAALAILVTGVLHVHELLLLLPRETAMPQAAFLLRDCFGAEYAGTSIVLTNFLSAYEYRFEDVLEKVSIEQQEREMLNQGGSVLCLPFADKDNPLAWAILAHEYGHALDDNGRVSREVLAPGEGSEREPDPKVKLKLDLDTAVVAETVADFIAAHVLGPASLMPILFIEMMQPKLSPIKRGSAGHPPTPLRVHLVCDYWKELGVSTTDFEAVFEAYKLDYALKLQDMEPNEREKVEEMGKNAEEVLSPIAKKIEQKVNSLSLRLFTEHNAGNARRLRETLASTQPISSRRSRQNQEILSKLNSLNSGETTPGQVYEVLTDLDEEPVAASEILAAGWLHRLSAFEDVLKTTFPTGQKADLTAYGKYVAKTDGLLQKSLEVAAVHAEVRRRLSAT